METRVVKLDPNKPDLGKIKEAAAIVDGGGIVAFPTETVYGIACRVRTESLTRLSKVKGRDAEKHYTLHIGRTNDVEKYVPTIGIKAGKLIKRAWPGPLTLVFELGTEAINKQRNSLKADVFENLYKDNSIGIRCPDNSIALALLQETRNPVVAPSANITGERPAVNAEEVLAQLTGQIDLLLDAGPCKYKENSTVVKIGKKGLEVLREGAYPRAELEEMSQVRFLFICTGNTCRSPMAEGIFRKYLAEKLGCSVDWLDEMGYKVDSAGVIDRVGFFPTAEAIAACAARWIDISAHESKMLSEQLVKENDFIFAMCRTHREHVISLSPEAVNKCVLLAENEDIADPIGQPQEIYNNCAGLIEKAVRKRIAELVI